jgi:hypothetical protein
MELGYYPIGKPKTQIEDQIANLHALGANHIHVRFTGKTAREQIDSLKWFQDTIS